MIFDRVVLPPTHPTAPPLNRELSVGHRTTSNTTPRRPPKGRPEYPFLGRQPRGILSKEEGHPRGHAYPPPPSMISTATANRIISVKRGFGNRSAALFPPLWGLPGLYRSHNSRKAYSSRSPAAAGRVRARLSYFPQDRRGFSFPLWLQ